MEIELNAAQFSTESDVEQKFVLALLTAPEHLGIPTLAIKTKGYIKPSEFSKKAGVTFGDYPDYPDYSVWLRGFPPFLSRLRHRRSMRQSGTKKRNLMPRA